MMMTDYELSLVRQDIREYSSIAAATAERLLDEIDRLRTRQAQLLATIVRVTRETPFPDEIKSWMKQRAKLLAEIGTLRSQLAESLREIERLSRMRGEEFR